MRNFRVHLSGGHAVPPGPYAHLHALAVFAMAPSAWRYRVADEECVLDMDHLVLVNPLTAHAPLPEAREGETAPLLGVTLAHDFVAERVAGKRGVLAARPFGAPRVRPSPELRAMADRLAAVIADPASPDHAITAATSDLANGVIEAYATPTDAAGPAFDYRIRRAIQIAAADPKRVATVEEMLAASELSRSRFFQLFRECTGLTPQMYIDAHTIETAIDALTRNDKPISRLARELGYGTPERFARYIRRMTGVGPRDFRRAAIRI